MMLFSHAAAAQTTRPNPRAIVIDAPIPDRSWPGWRTHLIGDDPNPTATSPPRYTEFASGDKGPTFSGKIEGLESFEGVEVVIISAVNTEYVTTVAHDRTMPGDDGSFSMISRFHLDLPKTLCVRAPGHPWTFLDHDFAVGRSGKDIVLTPCAGKAVKVTAQLKEDPRDGWMIAEAFDGYQRREKRNRAVRPEYYGGHESDAGSVSLLLPLRPMTLRVRCEGSATACVTVDPRQVDEVTVRLPREAKLDLHVVRGGISQAGKAVHLFNPFARLSWNAIETESDGTIQIGGLMPGPYICIVGDRRHVVTLWEGQTTEALFELNSKQRTDISQQASADNKSGPHG